MVACLKTYKIKLSKKTPTIEKALLNAQKVKNGLIAPEIFLSSEVVALASFETIVLLF